MSTDDALSFFCFRRGNRHVDSCDRDTFSLYPPGKEEILETTYGYIRVSSRDQNEDRQLDAMKTLVKPGNIYMDKQSGKDFQSIPSIKSWCGD